jgi:hypothetical protein
LTALRALQVNKIRLSLKLIAKNSTAYGLTQPHLDRTALCQLSDTELDPLYVEQVCKLTAPSQSVCSFSA